MRILVADDQRQVAALVARMVVCCEHEVAGVVTSGGLDVIAAYDRLLPDLVILDIQMPRLNGLTTCHVLMSRNPQPKVLFFSGNYHADHPFICQAGASRFLPKPATVEQMKEALDAIEASLQPQLCGVA